MPSRRSFLQSAVLLPSALAAQAFAQDAPAPSPSVTFADFDSGYGDWTSEGDAFGNAPTTNTAFSGKIRGFSGRGFACSLHPRKGNAATGKLISKDFTIEKPLLTFKIGGGNHPSQACLNLVVDNHIVRTATGDGTATLSDASWDVSALLGKKAHLEIVDATASTDRGYIMVDDIQFGPAVSQALSKPKIEPEVRVKPVFIVPSDAKTPTDSEKALLMLRLNQTQAHYRDMLRGLDTFEIHQEVSVERIDDTVNKVYDLAGSNEGRFQIQKTVLKTLFTADNVNRYSCPFIYYVVVTSIPSGRPDFANPINGGVNKGGGIVISYDSGLNNRREAVEPQHVNTRNSSVPGSYDLDSCGYLLRTVAHELGHAFGLTHTNDYGYEGIDAVSVMCHRQWKLVPEELQLLGMNKLVFPNFTYDPSKDVPKGYKVKPLIFVGAANV